MGNEIAGVPGHEVVHFALAAGTEIDHFPDVGKMVRDLMTRDLTRGLCLGDQVQEVVPLGVAQQMLDVSGKPELDTAFSLLRVRFKGGCGAGVRPATAETGF